MKATLLCTLTTISTGLLLSSSTPSFAAEGTKDSGNRPANIDPEARLAQMKERLKLTDEQVAKMKELGPEKTPEKMAKILEILTPEQREQMKAARENLGAQGGRENSAPGLPKIDTLKQKLELNESQVAKISPKLDEAHKALQDVLAQKDLSNEQKREKAKETIGPLMKSITEELTPEQRTKLREIVPPRPPAEGGARPKKS